MLLCEFVQFVMGSEPPGSISSEVQVMPQDTHVCAHAAHRGFGSTSLHTSPSPQQRMSRLLPLLRRPKIFLLGGETDLYPLPVADVTQDLGAKNFNAPRTNNDLFLPATKFGGQTASHQYPKRRGIDSRRPLSPAPSKPSPHAVRPFVAGTSSLATSGPERWRSS